MYTFNNDSENELLIEKNATATSIHEIDDPTEGVELINLKEAFNTMCALTLGSSVIVSPYLIRELGVITGSTAMALITLVQYYAACTLGISTYKFYDENIIVRTTRHAYQVIAEAAGGVTLRKISVVGIYTGRTCGAISNSLLAASTLVNIIPTDFVSRSNATRIFTSVILVALTPLSYLGTFSDLKVPILFGLWASLLSTVGVVVNCALVQWFYKDFDFLPATNSNESKQNIFISLGALFYLTAASANIPNICILCKEPDKIWRPTTVNYLVNYIVFLITGLIPYYVFNGRIATSVIKTFNQVITKHPNFITFKILTYVIQGLMLSHFLIAVLLNINPIFLHLEKFLDIPYQWSWKRMFARTCFMAGILVVCVAFPNFESAVSITGGVPLAVICALLPLFMYSRVFELGLWKKIGIYVLIIIITVIILGNLIASIINFI